METNDMTWADFYLICFATGFLFSLVSLLSGHVHLHMHHGHLHVGHHGRGSVGKTHLSPFNFGTGAAFLAWFGGAGYLAMSVYRIWYLAALGIAAFSGVCGAAIVFWFLGKVLMRQPEHLDPLDYEMQGVLGTVSSKLRPGGTGEMLYSREGFRKAAAIRSEDGAPIPAGVEVVVTRYESGIAYVRRWDELTRSDGFESSEERKVN
jgi:membrane protein implicated in regulation of membrane protease activity